MNIEPDIIFAVIYSACALVSIPFFSVWMYKNRSEAMNNSVLNCIIAALMLAYTWPMTALFMFFYKNSK